MSKFWNDKIKEIEPYVPGEQPKDKKYIKLNTNENPYSPSEKVIEKIKSMNLKDLKLYPDPDVSELRKVIAEYFSQKIAEKFTKEQIFVGNGSDEVLALVFMTFFNKGDKVYYPDITYSFYPVYADLFDLKEVKIPLNENFEIEIDKYFGLDGHIIITNPNAPTSIALKLNEIEKIVKNNPAQLVVIDEAYVDFGAESSVKLVNKYDNVLVVQTFSKSRSFAGMRLGYAIGSENIIEGLNRLKFSFNSYTIDRISIEAGIESFKDDDYFVKTNAKIIEIREKTVKKLKELGFKVLNSSANFIFISHKKIFAGDLYKQLKDNGILVRYFAKDRIDNYLRVTIGTDEEMEIFIDKLKKLL
ncbi:histidinol-phosphate transaminase [Leptotrichia sp. oral taxon 847]|uniref:histidinol-phosphate transaminase n=1 Tax=Leptotrichia sp. oral taxon 847 TaxID=1785996 RepID=UPI0007684D48|nr:histidinol-phosphate transaminase [Leptotrichia sp. oral taxon 847]AMD94175.1 histidinol-phosphate aminotransferase [Leptotrichia sp. oral taxon 847]